MSIEKNEIKVDGFGIVPCQSDSSNNYEIIKRYTLTNKTKSYVRLITWGAGVQSISVPNAKGILGDVVLGFNDIQGYLSNRFIGRTFGYETRRVFNDIISVNKRKLLSSTDDNSQEIFNDKSFDNVNWNSHILDNQVVMSHLSDNENKGKTLTQIKYSWTDENELHVNIRATSTRSSSVDVTNCYLLNLAGHGTGCEELKKHVITLNANECKRMDDKINFKDKNILKYVHRKNMFDLENIILLNKKRLYMIPDGGYNHFFTDNEFLNNNYYRFNARILHPPTGRFVEVYSNQPGFHFYTGHDLPNFQKINNRQRKMYGKDGILYDRYGGFMVSPSCYHQVLNYNNNFLNTLNPGSVYHHNMTLKFGVKTYK